MSLVEKAGNIPKNTLAFERSLWFATAGKKPAPDTFEVAPSYDAIIVGGGIAGAVALNTLARGGAKVLLLEANQLASGATGRSGGFVVPSFPMSRPGCVIRKLGEIGERLVTAVAGSANLLFSLVDELEIDCDAIQGGWIHPTTSVKKFAQLNEDAGIWTRFGGNVVVLDRRETERQTGIRDYIGSYLATSAGTVHPVKLVRGFISAAVHHGAKYLEKTPALSLERRNGSWQIRTPQFDVSSKIVILCTNGQSANLTPALDKALLPIQICQTASYPILEGERMHLFGQGRCLSDTRINLFTYRFDADWRLVSGTLAPLIRGSSDRIGRRVTSRLKETLMISGQVEHEFMWFGKASVTQDYLPRATTLGPGAYAFSACNGRGLAMSAQLAFDLANEILSGTPENFLIPFSQPRPYQRRLLTQLGTRLYPLYGRIVDKITRLE